MWISVCWTTAWLGWKINYWPLTAVALLTWNPSTSVAVWTRRSVWTRFRLAHTTTNVFFAATKAWLWGIMCNVFGWYSASKFEGTRYSTNYNLIEHLARKQTQTCWRRRLQLCLQGMKTIRLYRLVLEHDEQQIITHNICISSPRSQMSNGVRRDINLFNDSAH